MSKSGLFAHFGSKQELQIATIQAAREVFTAQVIDPALAARTGLERVRQLVENFLRYVEGGLYPGGCFFASVAAEMAMRPGPVRDGAVQVLDEFSRQLETAVRQAQAEGAIDPAEDVEQLAFELDAYLSLANARFALSQESAPIDRARSVVEDRIKAVAPPRSHATRRAFVAVQRRRYASAEYWARCQALEPSAHRGPGARPRGLRIRQVRPPAGAEAQVRPRQPLLPQPEHPTGLAPNANAKVAPLARNTRAMVSSPVTRAPVGRGQSPPRPFRCRSVLENRGDHHLPVVPIDTVTGTVQRQQPGTGDVRG